MKHAAALAVAAALLTPAHALEGTWTMERDPRRPDQVDVELWRGPNHHQGRTLPLDAFPGLDPAAETPARFTLPREAGDLAFEGTFRGGKGSGTFTFASRPAFLGELRALGIETGTPGEADLFEMAVSDVSVAFVRDMIAEGYRLPLDAYRTLRTFDVTPTFIREMRALGLVHLSQDDLVAFRIHGVTAPFAAQMRRLGYPDLSRDDLLAFRIHGVTGEFILELRDLGYAHLPASDLVAARIHGVTPAFIREHRDLPFDQLLDLRIRGVR